MSRAEFMKKLEELLSELQPDEKEEAIQYYSDYFDDAGSENETQTLEELGSPEKTAAIIKSGLNRKNTENGEFTENGYQDPNFNDNLEISKRAQDNRAREGKPGSNEFRSNSVLKTVLIVLLVILALPILLPLAGAAFAVILAVFVAVFAVAITLVVVMIAFLIAGILLIGIGFAKIIVIPIGAMCLLGAGLVLTGVSILMAVLVIAICTTVIPLVCRSIVKLCRIPFERRRVQHE